VWITHCFRSSLQLRNTKDLISEICFIWFL
jgi:hypothetical protein